MVMNGSKKRLARGAASLEALVTSLKDASAGKEKCKDGTRTMLPMNGSSPFRTEASIKISTISGSIRLKMFVAIHYS
jgi:hypothetical protein